MFQKRIEQMSPGLRRIVGNTGWLFLDRIVRLGLGATVSIWVARYLGPAQFGSLSFALSFVALWTTISTAGLDSIVPIILVREPDDMRQVLGSAFALRLVSSALATGLAILAVRLMQPDDAVVVQLVELASLGLVFQSFDIIDSYFQSQVKSRLTVWVKNSAFILCAAIRLLFIFLKAPLWSFALAQSFELLLGGIGLMIVYQRTGQHIVDWRPQMQRAVLLLRNSWPVMLSGMAVIIYMRIDMVMLKLMQGDEAVGIYATATRISEIWYFIPVALVSSVTPAIVRARATPTIYYERMQKLFCLTSLLALVIGSFVALASRWIIHALYSDAYAAAAPVLAVHVWASIFVFLGVAQNPWNVAENLMKLSFYRTLAGAVANVLLNLILIPRYSAIGAAVATVVSYAISAVFANAFDPRTRLIFILQVKSILPHKLWQARSPLA